MAGEMDRVVPYPAGHPHHYARRAAGYTDRLCHAVSPRDNEWRD